MCKIDFVAIVSLPRSHANRVAAQHVKAFHYCDWKHVGVGLPSLVHPEQALNSKITTLDKCTDAGLLLMILGFLRCVRHGCELLLRY